MMFHDVRDVEVARVGRFQFELQGRVVEYGETEFCLISGLRFGPYVDIINKKVSTSSTLRNRLFSNVRDEDLWLKDLEDYIKGPTFSTCSNEDAVMVMEMIFLLRGLIGRDSNTCIPLEVYELADSQYNWNKYLRDNEGEGYTKTMKYTIFDFQLVFKALIFGEQITPHPLIFKKDTTKDKLFGVVTELKTTIEHFGKRMDKWEKDKQFGVNNMENVDAGKAFFHGLDPESGHTYVQAPPPIVEVEDNIVTPLKGRIKMKSNFVGSLTHRLLKGIEMNWEFWSSLLGIGSRWLLSKNLVIWMSLLKEISCRLVVGMGDGPHCKDIDRVLITAPALVFGLFGSPYMERKSRRRRKRRLWSLCVHVHGNVCIGCTSGDMPIT
ncbi:unnamed protein product [Lactuca saligna]|uniref:Uncharacterized protein n=1 Tax=Lactuca saligna TaxID=75948 RepID=A0AA36EHR7_LACSI|nr:unnamed protein product [Lactuca saligna]